MLDSHVCDLLCIGSSKFLSEECFLNCGPLTTCSRSTWVGIIVLILGGTQHHEYKHRNEGWKCAFFNKLHSWFYSSWFLRTAVLVVTDKVTHFSLKWTGSQPDTEMHSRMVLMGLFLTQNLPVLLHPGYSCFPRSSYFCLRIPQPQVKFQVLLISVIAGKKELDSKQTNFNLVSCIRDHAF